MAWTEEKHDRLAAHIRARTLSLNREGFTLASGRTSSFLFNIKNLYGHPESASLVTEYMSDQLGKIGCETVAGLELGAVFPVTAVVAASYPDRPMHGFILRKKGKEHGSKNRVEGLTDDDPRGMAIIIDDVTTTGGSLYQAVEAARELGFSVEHGLTVVDREEGATEYLAARGITLHALFRKTDFMDASVV